MVLKITPKTPKILILLFILPLMFISNNAGAQTRVFATTITSQSNVDNAALATDTNLATGATVRGSSGRLLPLPIKAAYAGNLEIKFASTLPANTTTYVKIATDENLLPSLLGGSLGDLLSGVLGAVLIGNQEFSIQAKNSALLPANPVVLQGDSQDDDDFAQARLRLIIDAAGAYYIAITPNAAYDSISLTNRVLTLLAVGENIKNLTVYGAYYVSAAANCGSAAFTSFDGSGITLAALQLGVVQNPEFAIDASTTNFSTLGMGVVGVGSTVEQTVYFEGNSLASDSFTVRFRLAQNLVDANVANSIRVISYRGGTEVSNDVLSSLLTLNLLTLQGGQIMSIPVNPGQAIDRITLRFGSVLGISVAQSLDFYGITKTAGRPTVTAGSLNQQICRGSAASLTATTDSANELRWYNAATGGTLLATVAYNAAYTPSPTVTTTYYVAAARIGCTDESARAAAIVTVNTTATPTTINATQQFCGFSDPTIANLQVNETGAIFYAAATGGTALPSTTPLVDGTTYYAVIVNPVTNCESFVRLAITVDLQDLCGVTLNLKVMLQGALFGVSDGLMRDNLRAQGLIPLNQPYSAALNARFTHVNGGGTETTTNTVLNANAGTGNAIVDWIFIEIRDSANPLTVLKTASALLQRDGDIVAFNGGTLKIDALPESFYVVIKHRNHFGTMEAQPVTVVSEQVTLDFTTLADANIYTQAGFTAQNAMVTVGSVKALYSGNANYDIRVKYDGVANDRQTAAGQVLSHVNNAGHVLNFSNATGYLSGDINMDGKVLYDGASNDRQIILSTIIGYSQNTNGLNNFNGMLEQLPQ